MDSLRQLPGLRGAIISVMVVWAVAVVGLLDSVDELSYDLVLRLVGQTRGQSQVLLVEHAADTHPDWARVVDNLVAGGVRQVALLETPDAEGLAALAAGPNAARVVIALPLVEHADRPDEFHLARPPQGIPEGLGVGALALAAERSARVRKQPADIALGNARVLSTVEAVLARRAGIEVPPQSFQINFTHGLALPRIAAADAEARPPIAELAQDRIALIGAVRAPQRLEIAVPGAGSGQWLSELEFHGLALDTLLRGQAVQVAGPVALAAVIVVLALVLLVLFQPMPFLMAQWTTAVAMLLFVASVLIGLRWFDYWMPPLPGALIIIVMLMTVYREKVITSNRQLRRLMHASTATLQSRVLPAGFAESPEHWAYAINMVDQTLLLNRSIFLARIPGDHRVHEIQSLRCSISDISEMRRDFERAPYTTAIERMGTIEIRPSRPFLRVEAADERQFLAPLVFAGEVQGFWAFGVLRDKIDDEQQFLASADLLAEQIALLLYQRKIWRQKVDAGSSWQRYLNDDASVSMDELGRAISALEQRLTGFEEVFASLHTAAIYYDLFGRVVLINQQMSALLSDWKISPYEMTAVDLICALSQRSADEIRGAVRRLVFDRQTLVLGVVRGGVAFRHLLHVRPLRRDEQAAKGAGIDAHGIVLELVDVAEVQHALALKADALHFVFKHIGERLEAVSKLAADAGGALAPQISDLRALLGRAESLVEEEFESDAAFAIYPVRLSTVVAAAVEAARPLLGERELELEVHQDDDPGLVFAHPAELQQLLARVIALLGDDALSGSRIDIRLSCSDDTALVACANTGFGIPDGRLRDLLSPLSELQDPVWIDLRAAPQKLARWGGECRLNSQLGGGFRVDLQLRRFD